MAQSGNKKDKKVIEETLSKSIVDVFSDREFGAGPNSLPSNQSLRDRFASGTSLCRGNAEFFSVALISTC
jgi:hypothetical protein